MILRRIASLLTALLLACACCSAWAETTDATAPAADAASSDSSGDSVAADDTEASDHSVAADDTEASDENATTDDNQTPDDGEETIVENPTDGYWFYEAAGLRVEINRRYDSELRLIWYEADIRFSPEVPLTLYPADPDNPGRLFKYAERIARDNQIVFGINDDQFGHRLNRHETIGVVIRDGEIKSTATYRSGNVKIPNLDNCALFGDGTMQVFQSNEKTAEEYLAMGAKDVLCFGPYLIRDGEINPQCERKWRVREARCAIGMVEPYHFVAVMAEERGSKTVGISLQWVSEKLLEMGATQAFNLDGGHTACFVFMGKKLQEHNPEGIVRKARSLCGLIGFGNSTKLPAWNGVEEGE